MGLLQTRLLIYAHFLIQTPLCVECWLQNSTCKWMEQGRNNENKITKLFFFTGANLCGCIIQMNLNVYMLLASSHNVSHDGSFVPLMSCVQSPPQLLSDFIATLYYHPSNEG